ncbi:hypothetical protein D9615_009669 [Tricholomella constricta]|uniref:Uncharacterized protein n=1 Tax=Tricholomella constricta TaxID=117010 RepID=A0A8H5GUN5_9AGAR|nr:hypothetical protein D9615_009669 [Tricholomella constricta]
MGTNAKETVIDATGQHRSHHRLTLKGFELLALAATFMAAVQAQVMSTTLGLTREQETPALRAVNALFLSGFIFSLMSAFLAFLTSRWFQRLSPEECAYLEVTFERAIQRQHASHRRCSSSRLADPREPNIERGERALSITSDVERDDKSSFIMWLFHEYLAYSLWEPMTLLIIGVGCMILGLLILAWAEHALAVAIVLTAACVFVMPFPLGVFLIRQKRSRRLAIIDLLGKMQGDW